MTDKRAICLSVLVLLIACCSQPAAMPTPTPNAVPPTVTHATNPTRSAAATAAPDKGEIRFQSGEFELVGDLRLPTGGGRHPAIIMVHGSGYATRSGAVPFYQMFEIFLRNGYAVLSWDKPGCGESTGELDGEFELTQRAAILAAGVEVLAGHPDIDATRIGLWGISQAGWVMPLALELTNNVAFMIVVSGGGEDSIEQLAYRLGQQLASAGASQEDVALFEQSGARALKATSYSEYRDAMEILLEIPGVVEQFGFEMPGEDEWQPWRREIDAFIDPMEILQHTKIPVLALYGELDKDVDPVQGAAAYEAALQTAGNQDYQIEVLPGAGHVFVTNPAYLQILEAWLQHLSQ